MDFANPIAPSVLQTSTAQRQAAISKGQQLRRTQVKRRSASGDADDLAASIESAEEVTAIRRDSTGEQNKPRPRQKGYSPRGRLVNDDASSELDTTG